VTTPHDPPEEDSLITQPIPIRLQKWTLQSSITSLTHPTFRIYLGVNLVHQIAVWTLRVALEWLAFRITGSSQTVGLLLFLQLAPLALMSQVGSFIADRFVPRRLLVGLYCVMAVVMAVFSVVVFFDALELWHLAALSAWLGVLNTIEIPARSRFFSDYVPHQDLHNAISLNGSAFWVGGVVGPLIGGALVESIGFSAFTAVVALSSLAFGFGLWRLRVVPTTSRHSPTSRIRYVSDAVIYVKSKETIFVALVLLAVVATLCVPVAVTLPVFAADVFDLGANGYGGFVALLAAGAVVGSFLTTLVREVRFVTVLSSAVAFSAMVILLSLTTVLGLFLAAICVTGVARLAYELNSNVIVQLSSNRGMRARVVSVYVSVLVSGQALGGLLIGFVTDYLGPGPALISAGSLCLAITIGVGIAFPETRAILAQSISRGFRRTSR
jgi:MFS family permease